MNLNPKYEKILLKRSSQVTNGVAHKPSVNDLEDGEVALNTAKDHETLFIKNSNGEIVELPLNLLKTILDNEEVISNTIAKIVNAVGIVKSDGEIGYESDEYDSLVEAVEAPEKNVLFIDIDYAFNNVPVGLQLPYTGEEIANAVREGKIVYLRHRTPNNGTDVRLFNCSIYTIYGSPNIVLISFFSGSQKEVSKWKHTVLTVSLSSNVVTEVSEA